MVNAMREIMSLSKKEEISLLTTIVMIIYDIAGFEKKLPIFGNKTIEAIFIKYQPGLQGTLSLVKAKLLLIFSMNANSRTYL